jgi:adenosylhomocysteine nucleosidase
MRRLLLAVTLVLLSACAPRPPTPPAPVERIAVISAFEPELAVLQQKVAGREEQTINGVTFITGKLGGKNVVLFLSGVSMVNAAMTTQMALDHFPISRIVVSGVAGGADPSLDVGDVVVADRWGQYLESVMARKTAKGFEVGPGLIMEGEAFPNHGMIHTRVVAPPRAGGPAQRRFWFESDGDMLAIARNVSGSVTLKDCAGDQCLRHKPKIVVGGSGVSGPAFVDNAELREWAYKTFDAHVLDMESAAIAHVAYTNEKPFIAFRSLSDLAGGDPGENQWTVFVQLASDNSAAVVMAFLAALPEAH